MSLFVALPLLSLFSSSFGFPYYYQQSNICTGTVINGRTQAKVAECPVPSLLYGPSISYHPTQASEVTSPANIDGVIVACFLDRDGNPALNISINATSPDSPQEYCVDVLADLSPTAIYCGRISTSKPTQVPEKQEIGLEMNCNKPKLQSNMEVNVIVKAGDDSQHSKSVLYNVPNCDDEVMFNSNECKEKRRNRISFQLHQEGNSAVVKLNTQTAYPTSKSQVFVAIRQTHADSIDGWKTMGQPKILTSPTRSTKFGNLTTGNTYQVVVWRPKEYKRFARKITMRAGQKSEPIIS